VLTLDQSHQPASNVAPTRDCRQIIEEAQQLELSQSLQHPEVVGGTPNTSPREGQADQLRLMGRRSGLFPLRPEPVRVPLPTLAGKVYFEQFLLQNLLESISLRAVISVKEMLPGLRVGDTVHRQTQMVLKGFESPHGRFIEVSVKLFPIVSQFRQAGLNRLHRFRFELATSCRHLPLLNRTDGLQMLLL